MKSLPEPMWGPVECGFGRFVLRRVFLRMLTSQGHELLHRSARLQISLLVEADSRCVEFAVTPMLDRRTDLPTVMRYLRQWLHSEPLRIQHAVEDAVEGMKQSEPERQQTGEEPPTLGDEPHDALRPRLPRDVAARATVLEMLRPEEGEVVVEVGLNDVNERRAVYNWVDTAFREIEAAHPWIPINPDDDLSIQDPELEQILAERNRRDNAERNPASGDSLSRGDPPNKSE